MMNHIYRYIYIYSTSWFIAICYRYVLYFTTKSPQYHWYMTGFEKLGLAHELILRIFSQGQASRGVSEIQNIDGNNIENAR